jgi:hypothetical protein
MPIDLAAGFNDKEEGRVHPGLFFVDELVYNAP